MSIFKFDYNFFLQCLPSLLQGVAMTIKMTVIALLIAIVLGMVSCFLKISKIKIFSIISDIYVNIIRGTPLLVQAAFLYFGLPAAFDFRMLPFQASVIILSLNAGAYLSEIFRGGIAAVNKGQTEAARSLGLPYGVAMFKVVLPQAIKIVIPSVLNQFIITLKDTSILSAIGMAELMKRSNLIVARTFRAFEIYGYTAVMYFILIMGLTWIFRVVERRLSN